MSRETERVLVTDHLKNFWPWPEVRLAWPNFEFETPTNAMYAVVNIVERGTQRASLGTSYLKRSYATLQIDIYTPLHKGTKRSREMAEEIENEFDSLDLVTSDGQSVKFQTPKSRTLAANEQRAANLEDNWDRYVVECPFYREQIVVK